MSWNVQWVLSPSLSVSATDSPGVIDSSVCVSSAVLRASALYLCTRFTNSTAGLYNNMWCPRHCVLSDACALCIEHCILQLLLQPDDVQQCAFRLVLVHQCAVVAALYLCIVYLCLVLVYLCTSVVWWPPGHFKSFHSLSFLQGEREGKLKAKQARYFSFCDPPSTSTFLRKKTFVLQVISIYFS